MPLLILVTILLVFAIWPASAGAGSYDVYACRLPDGTQIPAKGWRAFESSHPESVVFNGCGVGGGLQLGFSPDHLAPHGWEAGWRFAAPIGTRISALSVYRWALARQHLIGASLEYLATLDGWPSPSGALGERCVSGPDSQCDVSVSRPFVRSGLQRASLFLGMRCTSPSSCFVPTIPGTEMQFEIRSARITLDDTAAPSFASEPVLNESTVTMSVADVGAGVSTVRLELDGRVVNQGKAACVPPFIDPVPCPVKTDVSLPFDVASLSDGDHTVVATAVDAAGNASAAPLAFTIRGGQIVDTPAVSPPSVAEVPAVAARARAWFSGRSRAAVRTLKYGERAVVEGTLADAAGLPVANAPVAVSERVIGVTSSRRPASLRTDTNGRFSYRLGVGPSRVVEFSSGAATARVTVRVRAGVTLRTSKTRVRNGSVLKFTGRVLGRQRALVTIYALSTGPRKRIPVETVRAGSSGRFSYTYRFARIPGPSVYRFEARVPKQTGFPYLEGSSRRVTVRGRP